MMIPCHTSTSWAAVTAAKRWPQPFTTWGGRIRSMIRERLCFYRKIPEAVERSTASIRTVGTGNAASLARFSDVLLLGHDWAEDQERLLGLLHALNAPDAVLDGVNAPRLGVIGSRSKWQAFENECREQGLPQPSRPSHLSHRPQHRAQSPEEIAVAVAAQIMSLHKGVDPSDATWRQA